MAPKKESNISKLFKSNRSKIVEAAIKSNFLELLKKNQNLAFNSFFHNIYSGWNKTKTQQRQYIANLKALWNNNKEDLTKEINQHKRTQKNSESPKKTSSVEQTDKKIKQGNQAQVVEDIKSQQNDCNKFKECEFLEDQSNLNNINENEEFEKVRGNSKPISVKQLENINVYISSDSTYHSSESPASEIESENKSLEKNYNSNLSLQNDESSEFRTIRTIHKNRIWVVGKAEIKKIFCFKTYRLHKNWANIVYKDYINRHNPYCVLVFNNRHVKKKYSKTKNSPLFKAFANCKHSSCKTKHIFKMSKK